MTDLLSAAPAGILRPKQLSKRIQRPERTLERWRSTGEGPPFIRLGRMVAYREADVERWLSGRTFASRAAELAGQAESQVKAASLRPTTAERSPKKSNPRG
jgi:predicted DNA-binding transcriptional regulator AlpA